jgi:hypothetical protein
MTCLAHLNGIFMHPFHQSACLCVVSLLTLLYRGSIKWLLFISRQRHGKNVTTATNTHVSMKEFWTRRILRGSCILKDSRRLVLPRTYLHVYHGDSPEEDRLLDTIRVLQVPVQLLSELLVLLASASVQRVAVQTGAEMLSSSWEFLVTAALFQSKLSRKTTSCLQKCFETMNIQPVKTSV